MAIPSKFYSNCPWCGKRIKKGDMIEKRDEKWGHVTCPSKNPIEAAAIAAKKVPPRNVLLETENTNPFGGVVDAEERIELPKEFVPSAFQTAIFDFIVNEQGNAVVNAVAGSGKTTTIVRALEYIPFSVLVRNKRIVPPVSIDYNNGKFATDSKGNSVDISTYPDINLMMANYKICFIAFNKHIVKELKRRKPDYVKAATVHSLGLETMRRNFPGIKIDEDGDKLSAILDPIWPVSKKIMEQGNQVDNPNRKVNILKRNAMRKLVAICKATLIDYKVPQNVVDIIEFYNIEIEQSIVEEVVRQLPHAMYQCQANTSLIDFDDMLWMPIVLNLRLEKFDYLFVDERQDMNACQIEYIMRSLNDNGRVIAVGDENQSLYGFRGADIRGSQKMIDALNAKILPLSVTYRNPTSHVKLAQRFVPEIQAPDTAIEGTVQSISEESFLNMVEPGDMVLCRTNAPLIPYAFDCIRRGKKAIIRGRDIGKSLVQFIEKFEADSLSTLEILMSEFETSEMERLLEKGKELQAAMLEDKIQTIRVVANECKSVQDLISKLKMLFDDSNIGIVFSSVHRAKGLETKNVFILKEELLPHPKATKPWELVQEDNTHYVALTRSKENLYFVKEM